MASWMFWRRGGNQEVREGVQVYGPDVTTSVNFDTSMQVSAFWACVRLLTETVAAMPLRCYRMDGDRKMEDNGYPLFRLLNQRPNLYQTRTEFFESLMLNLVCHGNAYCLIQRSGKRIIGLLPIPATQMEPWMQRDGSLLYKFTDLNSKQHVYNSADIWHVKLFGNGYVGLSPLSYATKSLEAAIIQENRASIFTKSGGKIGGYIETPVGVSLKKEQRDGIREEIQGIVSGTSDFLPLLEMGCKFIPTSLSPADVKLMESRRFSIEDIARFMGAPSVLINDTSGSTVWGSGIGQLVEGFYKLNMRPYLERIESSIKRHLMPPSDFDGYSIEFDFDSLLRSDLTTRVNAMSAAINSGQLTPNEARADEGRGPLPGGDQIYLNGSLVAAGTNKNGGNDEKIPA